MRDSLRKGPADGFRPGWTEITRYEEATVPPPAAACTTSTSAGMRRVRYSEKPRVIDSHAWGRDSHAELLAAGRILQQRRVGRGEHRRSRLE